MISIGAHGLALIGYAAWSVEPSSPALVVDVGEPRELAYHELAVVEPPTVWSARPAEPELQSAELEEARALELEPEQPAPELSVSPDAREGFDPRLERIPMSFASFAASERLPRLATTIAANSSAPVASAAIPVASAFVAAAPITYLNAPPSYPKLARARGWEGTSLLEVRVGADGSVLALRLLESSGHDVLDRAALEAVGRWRFTPARSGKDAIASTVEAPIVWRLAKR